MKLIIFLIAFISITYTLSAQSFTRTELPTEVITPWEIVYGPDGYLWITEAGGTVSRINPETGEKKYTYTAPDYYAGSPLEQLPTCFTPNIGAGTLGMDLDPNFMRANTAYIYYVYSYNSGSETKPATKFKIVRLNWDWTTESVTGTTNLVTGISTGYDHLGGRLKAIVRNGTPYLFLSVGDHGISETNSPDCYVPPSSNPNYQAQNPNTDNGKIHRFNMNGSIPSDNPIKGNSFYTRGHRNPQGLMYIPNLDLLFDVEHGDRTDDEINLLQAGMNYGWKWVRGYHADNNYPGESEFIANYVPNPLIAGDRLVEAFYSWCDVPQPTIDNYLDWCTVAPSDGIYYNASGIPEWSNSLLVVSLKNGSSTDNQVHIFNLTPDGKHLVPSTPQKPNPSTMFGADQGMNGRLRDITYSSDGKKIFLINNGGVGITDKITVYTVLSTSTKETGENFSIQFLPNPTIEVINIQSSTVIMSMEIYSISGKLMRLEKGPLSQIQIADLSAGTYLCKLKTATGLQISKMFTKL
ncbi:MAG: PQQ-dependent sugar dehydrogenase [Saprospiraceae bacterium]